MFLYYPPMPLLRKLYEADKNERSQAHTYVILNAYTFKVEIEMIEYRKIHISFEKKNMVNKSNEISTNAREQQQ